MFPFLFSLFSRPCLFNRLAGLLCLWQRCAAAEMLAAQLKDEVVRLTHELSDAQAEMDEHEAKTARDWKDAGERQLKMMVDLNQG